jgi:hypothetical protein
VNTTKFVNAVVDKTDITSGGQPFPIQYPSNSEEE